MSYEGKQDWLEHAATHQLVKKYKEELRLAQAALRAIARTSSDPAVRAVEAKVSAVEGFLQELTAKKNPGAKHGAE